MSVKKNYFPIFAILLLNGIKSAEIPYEICEGIKFGYLPHPDPQRCTEYIICFFEEFHVFRCAYPGHIFYPPYTYCVRGDPETCQVLIQVTTLSPNTTIPVETTTTDDTTTLSDTTTENTSTATTLSDTTTENTSTTLSDTTTENTTTITEDAITSATEGTTTTKYSTTTTSPTNPNDLCKGINFDILPYPGNCTMLVICIFEVATFESCRPGEIFYNGTCVEGDPDTCEVFTTTTTEDTTTKDTTTEDTTTKDTTTDDATTTTTEDTTTDVTTTTTTDDTTTDDITTIKMGLPDDFCKNNPTGFLPHPYNCTLYVICMSGNPMIISCTFPNVIFYNGSCTAGDPLTCEIFTTITTTTTTEVATTEKTTTENTTTKDTRSTTTEPINSTTTISTSTLTTTAQQPTAPPNPCDGNNFRFIPDPDSCYRFFYCINGVALPGECDLNMIFSEQVRGCIEGDRNAC